MARLHAERANKKIRWNRLITGHQERSQVAGEEVITRYQGKGLRSGPSWGAKRKTSERCVANRIISPPPCQLTQPLFSRPGKKPPVDKTLLLYSSPRQKSDGKGGHFCIH